MRNKTFTNICTVTCLYISIGLMTLVCFSMHTLQNTIRAGGLIGLPRDALTPNSVFAAETLTVMKSKPVWVELTPFTFYIQRGKFMKVAVAPWHLAVNRDD